MERIVLHSVPETPWRKRRVLDEDGHLGPAERILHPGALSTNPPDMIRRALGECQGFILEKA